MKIISFFKEQWNLVASFSVTIVVLLTKIIVPPNIDLFEAAGGVNNTYLARFVVIAILLLALYPFAVFKRKKHGWLWWIAALLSLVTAIVFFISYLNFTDRKTGYNEDAKERKVIGDHLYPVVTKFLDSVKAAEHLDTITPDDIVGNAGEPRFNYPPAEIKHNANQLLTLFAVTILFTSLFIVFSIQAAYCSKSKN